MLPEITLEFTRYKDIGARALDQATEDVLNRGLSDDMNSIAVIVRHVSGNLISRFTDFLTTDGEKPWRDRDSEFEQRKYSKSETLERWNAGWSILEAQLAALTPADLDKTITIRDQPLTVREAPLRSLAHTSYHVGQITLLAHALTGPGWQWITLPRARSE